MLSYCVHLLFKRENRQNVWLLFFCAVTDHEAVPDRKGCSVQQYCYLQHLNIYNPVGNIDSFYKLLHALKLTSVAFQSSRCIGHFEHFVFGCGEYCHRCFFRNTTFLIHT